MTIPSDIARDQELSELRSFGVTMGAVVAILFGGLIPWVRDVSYPLWPWLVLTMFGIGALIAPMSLRPLHIVWMRFGSLISKVTTPIIVGVIFLLIIVPVALVMKIFGHDPMKRQFDTNVETYRKKTSSQSTGPLEKPY